MRSLLFIEDSGLWLSVRAGELALRQRDGSYVHLDEHIRIIVAAAHGFCVTCTAIRYCSARHIELYVSDDVSAFVSLLAPEARGDARRAALKVRERQFRAAFNPRRTVEIARAIIAAKIKAESYRGKARQAFLTELQRTKTVDDVRHVEAASLDGG